MMTSNVGMDKECVVPHYDPQKFHEELYSFAVGLVPSSLLYVDQNFDQEDLAVLPEPTVPVNPDEVIVRLGFLALVAYIRKRFKNSDVCLQVLFNSTETLRGRLTWSWVDPTGAKNIDSYEVDGRFWLPRCEPETPLGYRVVKVTKGNYTAKMWERI